MTASIRRAAGSLLVVGLSCDELTALERAWLKLIRPAGIILFRRNIADARQTRALLADAISLCASHALRCVDLEGGAVDRLRDALAPVPSAQAVALHASKTGKSRLAYEHGDLIARAVKAFGFNTTLAPVLDLGLSASASVLGTRAAAPSASGVIAYARHFLAGAASQRIATCAKHFPGLGAGALDSHAETPSIDRSFSVLWREDLLPYRNLRDRLPMVMVNHAAYPTTPGKATPASVSRFWIANTLRKRIGYRGLIFSDDMEMGGILRFMSIEDAVVASVRAGMDLIEICHSPELILRAFDALITEAERSAAFRKILLDRSRTTTRKRAALFANNLRLALSSQQFESLRDRIVRFREKIESTAPPLPRSRIATPAETA